MLDNISKKAVIGVAIAGSLLAAAFAGGMILLAGGPAYMALELGGFILYVEIMYWALAAAFAGIRATLRRRQLRGFTMEEKIVNLEARLEAARERNRERGRLIKAGICPRCKSSMTKAQHGRLVVAKPCNHILYEGRLK